MKKIIEGRVTLILTALFLSFTLCVFAPFEMYLGNVDEFWFAMADIWWMPLCVGAFVFLGLMAVGLLVKGKIRLVYEALIFGGGLAVWLQGNFLNLNLGVQNGAKIYWQEYHHHFAVNLAMWILIVLVPVLLTLWKNGLMRRIFVCLSTFFCAIQAVTLIILLVTVLPAEEEKGKTTLFTDKDCYSVSSEDNIIVFLLDMFDDTYFTKILDGEPELTEKLDGFTCFTNS